MKKILLISLMSSTILLMGVGCKKDNSSSTNTTTSTTATTSGTSSAVMTAKINGIDWNAASFQNTLVLVQDVGKRMDLRGTSSDGKQIILTMEDDDFVIGAMPLGTYSFDDNTALFTYLVNNNSQHLPIEGTLTITAANPSTKKVSGTFNFKSFSTISPDTLAITNGVFTDLTYSVF